MIFFCTVIACLGLPRWCLCMRAKSLQLCLTLCNPMGRSPPGSSVHGILQSACECRNEGSIPWVGKIPWRRKWQPTLVLPGKSHAQRSLVGCSPWGRKESDMTDGLTQTCGGDYECLHFTDEDTETRRGPLQACASPNDRRNNIFKPRGSWLMIAGSRVGGLAGPARGRALNFSHNLRAGKEGLDSALPSSHEV